MCIRDSPEYEKLQQEVNDLRLELSDLIFKKDELLLHECKNIEADYMIKISSLEYKVFELQVKIFRIKRKIELVQAKVNNQEVIVLPLIENQLDEEYREYEENLRSKINIINNALHLRQCPTFTDDETAELKSLYKTVVKTLHPDLNPNITDEQQQLFLNAVDAYENGDLITMKTIVLLIEQVVPDVNSEDGIKQLLHKKEMLIHQIAFIQSDLDKIKISFPYNQIEFLKDTTAIEARKTELNGLLVEYKEFYAYYEKQLSKILGQV